MSLHSYSRVWLHVIWATHHRSRVLLGESAKLLSDYFNQLCQDKDIYLKMNYVNPEHVHLLLDLPTHFSIAEMIKQLKGNSSHWINQSGIVQGKFRWGRGYAAFSVSHSAVSQVAQYIGNQDTHHKRQSFMDEYREFMQKYELAYHSEIG